MRDAIEEAQRLAELDYRDRLSAHDARVRCIRAIADVVCFTIGVWGFVSWGIARPALTQDVMCMWLGTAFHLAMANAFVHNRDAFPRPWRRAWMDFLQCK